MARRLRLLGAGRRLFVDTSQGPEHQAGQSARRLLAPHAVRHSVRRPHGPGDPEQLQRQLALPHGCWFGLHRLPGVGRLQQTNPVGTGPFKFAAWNRGSSLQLTRNDAYWGSKAKLKDVEFRFISDANAMNNALTAGDIDAIGQVGGPEQLQSFSSNQNFTVIKGAPTGKVMVSINNTSGPLADKRVRQAIYAAIDRKAWIDGIQFGYGVPIGSHSAPNGGEPYYVDETSVNPFDPNKAKQLLASAGYSSGLTL